MPPESSEPLDPPLYRTSSRYLAAYLLSKRYPLIRSESEGDFLTFLFPYDDHLDIAVQAFYNNSGVIQPQSFIQGFETVQQIIRDQKRRDDGGVG